ncbi:divalent cation tolerance protein CutA [Candidatus Ichthyocystis hellenicum]|uniref:divalent cation tolerance protein CutA n=1 Tax=Candidatus Ichthyocystis hellenicum TaxID=1561003 RepID=UPI000B892C14|nr:divalent cation tolerance protein CutA [Candidatus Ichthyocystis hellenicum]
MSKIILRNLVRKAFVGVYDYEQYQKQTVSINATLHLPIKYYSPNDSNPEIDYDDIIFGINNIINNEKFLLLESLSQRLMAYLFEYPPIEAVHLQVFKERPAESIDSVGIDLFQTRSSLAITPESVINYSEDVVLVKSHAPSAELATSMIQYLIERKLAACGALLHSVVTRYIWENQMQTETVFPFEIKTIAGAVSKVIDEIKQRHPDEVPEITVHPVSGGLKNYLDWVRKTVKAF